MAVSAVLLFYTSLDNFLYRSGGPGAAVWVMAFLAAGAMLLALEPHRPIGLLRSPFLGWLLLYFSMTTLWVPFASDSPEVRFLINDHYRSMACALALALLFDDERARRWAIAAVAVCVAVASLINIGEFFSVIKLAAEPGDYAGRASGLNMNPNGSGLSIAMGLAVVAERVPRRLRVPLLLLSTAGVVTTFSRGAAVCLVMVFLWLVWRKALPTAAVILGVACGAFLLAYALDIAGSKGLLDENTAARLHGTKDDSGRIALALKAWELFLSSPWVGNGIGATRIWDADQFAHNIFATLAAEHGIIGLLTFPALGLALYASNRESACLVLVLMLAGFVSHDLLDDRSVLLLAALSSARPIAASELGVGTLVRDTEPA